MSKNIQEALLDLKARQEAGEKMPCPRARDADGTP